MANYYAERAKEYERIYQKPERQEELRQLRDLVQRTFADTHVLEIACGTGYWTEFIARSAVSVVATDINEEVLAIARSKPIDHQKTSFRTADAYTLPPFPQKFTAGLAAFWWSHVPRAKLRGFLEKFHRAVSPGGKVVFLDNCYVEGNSTHEVLKNFPTEPEVRETLASLASEVHVQFLKYYWIVTYRTLSS